MAHASIPVIWVANPRKLPAVPAAGRLALVDVAFANKENFELCTRPFIERVGSRLVAWIDHHEHPAWVAYERDPRFVLAPRRVARACPELITPGLVARLGPFEHLLAHADLDGLLSAAKLLGGGEPPYPECDEDARAVDSPGRGFRLSARGERLARALDQAELERSEKPLALLDAVLVALRGGREPAPLAARLDALAAAHAAAEASYRALADRATRPHPEILVYASPDNLTGSERKRVLRVLEERARVAVVTEPGFVAVATFHDDGEYGVDVTRLHGLQGIQGYVYGKVDPTRVLAELERLLRR